jgi:polyhydroxybutyrate depolymerase
MNIRSVMFALASIIFSAPLFASAAMPGASTQTYQGREMIVYVPSRPSRDLALVVVLHGGLGNAQHIESQGAEHALNLDALAEKDGFIVAYLNGTPATRFFGADKLAWNAGGGCCGQAAANNVDDVRYISDAVRALIERYHVDAHRIYGMGHSNGAMMTQRLICETTLYQAAVVISGPLNLDTATCPAARGKRILAIHGADDENVPVAGGRGTQGFSSTVFRSVASSRDTFVRSGATYDVHLVAGVGHRLDDIDAAIQQTEGRTIGELAIDFFGLGARQ